MKEKYKKLKKEISYYQNACNHNWGEPIYDPDLFEGDKRWKCICKNCGKVIYTFDMPNVSTLKMLNKNEKTTK